MAGRKPKPTAVKKLEGNPGKRKLNTKEPNPGKGMPDCLAGSEDRMDPVIGKTEPDGSADGDRPVCICSLLSVLCQMERGSGAHQFRGCYL